MPIISWSAISCRPCCSALADFTAGKAKVLIATDLAARGLDVVVSAAKEEMINPV